MMARKLKFVESSMACIAWMRLWTAQLVMLLFKTGEAMLDAIIRPYIATAVCRDLVFPNTSLCSTDEYHTEHGEDIQATTASYLMYYRIILYSPPALLNFVCGAWSDKTGRKLPMMLPSLGSVIGIVIYMFSSYSMEHSLTLLLVGTMVQGLFGKTSIILMAVHSYVAETSSVEDRTSRLSSLWSMGLLGQCLGSLLAGVLQDFTSMDITLCVVSLFHTLSIMAVVLCVHESIKSDNGSDSHPCCINLSAIKESVMVVFKERSGSSRSIIILLSLTCILNACLSVGESDITVLYIEGEPLVWPNSWYGYYMAIDFACSGCVLLLLIPFLTSRFQVRDTTILILASVSRTLRAVWSALSTRSWMMWTSAAVGCLGGAQWSIASSMLSKEVEENELGKLYSLMMILSNVTRPSAAVFYVKIYVATLHLFTGAAYMAQAAISLLFLLITLIVINIKSKDKSPEEDTAKQATR